MRAHPPQRGHVLLLSSVVCSMFVSGCGGTSGNAPSSAPAPLAAGQSNVSITSPVLISVSAGPSLVASQDPGLPPLTIPVLPAQDGTPPDLQNPAVAVITTPPPPSTVVAPSAPPTAPTGSGALLTDVKVRSVAAVAQAQVPITFGQVFKPGEFLVTDQLAGKIGAQNLPLQLDIKATYADKSVRHAVVSAVLPTLAAGEEITIALQKAGGGAAARQPQSRAALLASGFDAKVTLVLNGQTYTASAAAQLATPQGATWLVGNVANEWLLKAPFRTASGVVHPHLTARFDVRSYAGLQKAKVDVIVENDRAYEPAPSNLTYDASVSIAGTPVYTKTALTHFHHARWKKTFWWGDVPAVQVKPNVAHLIATRAVPNFDQTVLPSAAVVNQLRTSFSGAVTEPMQSGLATPYMPQTGGRPDIGLLPMWAVTYLLGQDPGVGLAMYGTADLAGSWSTHYRDKQTDRVVSLFDYPYMTLLGQSGDTYNPVTKKTEAFPACSRDCSSTLTPDSAHQPNFSYLPYLLSGDHYYLEEMQFWAMFNMLQHNPGYRDNIKGLVRPDQIRGQAWSMRSLGEVAAFSPDTDALKPQFATFLSNNLDWYNSTYANNAAGNQLGALINENALVYDDGIGIAPWQDDFFTAAIGHSAELGFSKASTLMNWKAKFPVARMIGAGYCWIDAPIYKMIIRDTPTGSNFTDIAKVYQKSETAAVLATSCGSADMANALGKRIGEMVGYADSIDGFPSYLQVALAYSVDAGAVGASSAWTRFMNRAIKPDYSDGAQFNILPR